MLHRDSARLPQGRLCGLTQPVCHADNLHGRGRLQRARSVRSPPPAAHVSHVVSHLSFLPPFLYADDKEFYGLAPSAGAVPGVPGTPGKTVGLRYAGYLRVLSYTKDSLTGKVTELQCEYDHDRAVLGKGEKVKGNIHFVSGAAAGAEPPTVEVRLYEHLFHTETPGSTGDWESELNLNSETVLQAKANPALVAPGRVKVFDKFQFERVGYFVCDTDSNESRLVFNQTVGLKEATEVKKVKGHA